MHTVKLLHFALFTNKNREAGFKKNPLKRGFMGMESYSRQVKALICSIYVLE